KYVRYNSTKSGLRIYDNHILNFLDNGYHSSWLNHGINEEVMEAYKIGWYSRNNAITIPVFDSEMNLVGIRCRNVDPKVVDMGLKYIPLTLLDGSTYSFPTNSILYGVQFNEPYIKHTKRVLLCESEKAVLKLASWYGIDKNNSLAMYGHNLSTFNRDYLLSLGIEEVIIVADRDYKEHDEEYDEWEKSIFKLAKMFKGFVKVYVAYDKEFLLGYKDNITDGNKETFEYYMDNLEEVLWD
ncbi:MAG: hypothetical protein ACRDD8_09350, partial [Bacteroidales bacterium]